MKKILIERGVVNAIFINRGYACVHYNGEPRSIHSLIMEFFTGVRPGRNNGLVTDHINRDKLDCRTINLRAIPQSKNNTNISKRVTSKSGYKGVHYSNGKGKFVAGITYNKKTYYLGLFNTAEMAAKAYNIAALKYFGPRAFLNKI